MIIGAVGISNTPIEILERILDFLLDDRPALYPADLVRREWVAAVRYDVCYVTQGWFYRRKRRPTVPELHHPPWGN
jgi:hypothetical protein